jgi:hypothetical protein
MVNFCSAAWRSWVSPPCCRDCHSSTVSLKAALWREGSVTRQRHEGASYYLDTSSKKPSVTTPTLIDPSFLKILTVVLFSFLPWPPGS